MVKKRGRNLHAGKRGSGPRSGSTGTAFTGSRGTIRYPKAA